ncbi:MAG: hypothetical protein ACK4NC_00745 [Candidatus Gracilibacteria bacterium]
MDQLDGKYFDTETKKLINNCNAASFINSHPEYTALLIEQIRICIKNSLNLEQSLTEYPGLYENHDHERDEKKKENSVLIEGAYELFSGFLTINAQLTANDMLIKELKNTQSHISDRILTELDEKSR